MQTKANAVLWLAICCMFLPLKMNSSSFKSEEFKRVTENPDSLSYNNDILPEAYNSDLFESMMMQYLDWEERVGVVRLPGKEIYPEWFGGFYIEDDTMFFLLLNETVVSTLPKGAKWKKCKYSYNHLSVIRDWISKRTDEYKLKCLGDFLGMGINQKINRLIINIKDCNETKIKFFKDNIFDGDEIIIKNL